MKQEKQKIQNVWIRELRNIYMDGHEVTKEYFTCPLGHENTSKLCNGVVVCYTCGMSEKADHMITNFWGDLDYLLQEEE